MLGGRRGGDVVRVVVAGDTGTGKTCLVQVAPLFPHCDNVPITIIDTSSRVRDTDIVADELQRADSVILTYACDCLDTLQNLSTFWLPHLRQLEVKAPVIVVGCKLDLLDENQQVSLEQVMSPLMQQFCEIEACMECSSYNTVETPTPRCVRALKRIFFLCDRDKDGALSDVELNDFQVKCFNSSLEQCEILDVKKVVQTNLSEGVNERGLTLTGFLFLHTLFMEKGPPEATWTVLRKFGYNYDIKLSDDLFPPLKRAPDQSVELTDEAIDFLKTIFDEFDGDFDKVLQPRELEELFSTTPESPWIENPYKDAVGRNMFGGLSLNAFLSEWALKTLLNPAFSMESLINIGYPGDPSSSIRVTRRGCMDYKKQNSERNVLQGFVFGPRKAGKSALLNSFIGRPYSEAYNPTNEDRFAVNIVDISRENKKYLVLREISEGGVTQLLANKKSSASCDIAIFVYDRSDESSWKASYELLLKIVRHGEDTGFQVPCLMVAAKDDQDSFTMAIEEETKVSQDMGVDAPIPISVKLGDFNNVFHRIVSAAEPPHLSISETEAGKTHKQFHRVIDRSLKFVSAVVAVAFVVVVARKNVSARKNVAARKNASG